MDTPPTDKSGESSRRGPSALLSYARPVVAIVLMVLLVRMVKPDQLVREFSGARLSLVALAMLIILADMATSSLKLWILVRTGAPNASFLRILRAYYVGSFFNYFLPTSVGGDLLKISEMRKDAIPTGHAAASVVVERAAGVLTVLALAAIVSLGWGGLFDTLGLRVVRWPLAAASVGSFLLLIALYVAWTTKLKPFLKARRDRWALGKLYTAIESFYVFRNHPRALIWAALLSTLFYGLIAANIVVIARAFHAHVTPALAVGIMPILKIPEMLPVSVGALGVREGMLTYCLGRLGLAHAQAFGVALLLRLLSCLHSGIGGCMYALGRRTVR